MQFRDLLRRSWKNVSKSKVRFVLTALSLAVGAFTISLTLAISSAARGQFEETFQSQIQKDGIMVIGRDSGQGSDGLETSEEAEARRSTSAPLYLLQEDVTRIKAIEGVKEVQPIREARLSDVIINGKTYELPTAAEPFTFNASPELVAGSFEQMGNDGVLVPESFAKAAGFSKPEDMIGQKVQFAWQEFRARQGTVQQTADATVKGVVKAGSSKYFDTTYLALPLNESVAQRQYEASPNISGDKAPPTYKYIGVIAASEAVVPATSERIKQAGYEVYSISEVNKELLQAIDAIQFFFLGIAGIAILAAIFGVINTQYMAVYERTREIGVMKALGLSRRGVLSLFAIEAAWIGVAGSVIGLLLSLPVMLLLNTAVKESIAKDLDGPLAVITLPNVLIVIITLGAIALIAGLLPARKASRLNPVDALRVE